MINTKNFHSNLLKIDKKSCKDIGIYYIAHITIERISDYEDINSVNPFYMITGKADGYIEENSRNKNLIFPLHIKTKKY